MHETRINWGQRVELVAQAAIRAPEAIKIKRPGNINPDTPVQYGSPAYFKIISKVVNAAFEGSLSFGQRAARKVLAGLLGLKFWKAGFEATAYKDNFHVLPKLYASSTTTAREVLPDVLGKLAQAPANELIRPDLVSIGDQLKSGDPALGLKFTLDGLRGTFDELGLNPYFKGKLLFELAEHGLPQLRNPKPENLTPGLLETIENYGLRDYVYIPDFFSGVYGAKEAGEQYDRRIVGYGTRPSRDEVSSIPYEQRLSDWERECAEYRQQKLSVARQLSDLKEHLDRDWVTANLSEVERILNGVLDHPMTNKIMAGVTNFGYAFDRSSPDFQAIAGAIKTVYKYGKSHPSEYSIYLLMMSLDQFMSLIMGLYNLKKGK